MFGSNVPANAAEPTSTYSNILPLDMVFNVTSNYGIALRSTSSNVADRSIPVDYATHLVGGAAFTNKVACPATFGVNHATSNTGYGTGNNLNNCGWNSPHTADTYGLLLGAKFNAGLRMPAKTKCTVRYTFSDGFYFIRTNASGGSVTDKGPQNSFIQLLSYGQTGSDNVGSISGNVDWSDGVNALPCAQYSIHFAYEPIGTGSYTQVDNITTTVTLTNDGDTAKDVTADFEVLVGCLAAPGIAWRFLNHAFASVAKIEVLDAQPILEPDQGTQTYTYTEAGQTIDLTDFDDFYSDCMYVSGIQKDNPTAGTVAPTVVNPGTSATQVQLTDAGTYTVTLKKKGQYTGSHPMLSTASDFVWKNPSSSDGSETKVKLVVKKKQMTVPNFGAGNASTQVYDGTLKTFTASNPLSNALANYPLTTTVARTGGAPNTAPAQTDNGGTLDVAVRDAGAYTATFAITDTVNYEWSDGTQTNKTAGFTVSKASLTLTPTATTTGGVWKWRADDTGQSATLTASGFFDGDADFPADTVGIRMELTDTNGTSQYTGTYSGGTYTFKIEAATFNGSYSPGIYSVKLVFTGGTHDGNYDLDGAMSALGNLQLEITAAKAGLSSYDFQIREIIDSTPGAWSPIAANGSVAYTGNTFEIGVIQTDFASNNIKLDESPDRTAQGFVKGYKNESAINAGTYTTRVAIAVTDPSQFAFPDGTTTTEITFTWKIDKATITGGFKWQYTDASGVVQTYDPSTATDPLELPWKGSNYTLTLTDLPNGVTVNPGNSYSSNVAKAVASYTATCTSLNYDTTNYDTIPTPTLAWSIVPLEVEINSASWKTDEQTSGSGVFFLPHLNSPYDGTGIIYEYYYFGTSSGAGDYTTATKLDGLADIEYEEGTTRYYCVLAKLSSGMSTDGVTPWNQALKLVETTTPPNGDCTMAFTTGSNRTPVSVTLSGNPFTYNGKPHGELNKDLFVKVGDNNFDTSQFDIRYYTKDDYDAHTADPENRTPLSGAPVNAGNYVIVVGLSGSAADDYFLNASVFDMVIEKYVFDMSGAQWGYEKDGQEVAYNPATPLEYDVDENGDPVMHELKLIGLPKGDASGDADAQLLAEMFTASGLSGFLSYTNNTANSVTGTTPNRAEYTFTPDAAFTTNFDVTGMPAQTPFEWRVDFKKIPKPQDDNSRTFDGEEIDLLDLAGLDAAGIGRYFDITAVVLITPGGDVKTLSVDDIGTFKDAGEYRLTARLKDTTNMRWDDNGILKTAAQQFRITVNVLEITVSDWEGDGNEPFNPIFNNGVGDVPNVWRSIFVDSHGNTITDDSWSTMFGETFKQTLAATEGNEENVKFVYPSGVDEEKTFTLINPEEITLPIDRPVFGGTVNGDGEKESVFTGAPQSFLPDGLKELVDKGRVKLYAVDENGKETAVDLNYFTQTKAGKYTVRARINGPYAWSDTGNKAPMDYVFTVKPAPLSPVWTTDDNGNPKADMPAGFDGVGNVFEYRYFDESGTEIAEKDLKGGEKYRVGVSVKEEYKNDFILQNKDGSEATDGVVYAEEEYTHPNSGIAGFITQDFMGLPMWLWLLLILLLIILLIIIIVVARKKKKAKKEKNAADAEKQEEKDRLEAEKREREEEKRRKEEERQEEKRRKEEEREEEKRRKEEEREEEKRRREEEREEEKRRREDQREEERRRMEDERRRREEMAAANAMNNMQGMNGMNGMNGMMNNMGMMNQPMMPMQQPQMPYQQPYQQPQYPQYQQPAPPPAPQPQYQQSAPQQPTVIYTERDDSEAYGRLREYEGRLRSLERELDNKRIENIRNEEHAKAQREMQELQAQRRREEELQRLRDLQAEELRRQEEEEMRYRERYDRYDRSAELQKRRRDMDDERLRKLEEDIVRKETENRMLEARFRDSYAPYPQEVYRLDSKDTYPKNK